MKQQPVRDGAKPALSTIITHVRPHVDELFAIWLILKYGQASWAFRPQDVRIVFVGTDEDALLLASPNVALVGVGGGTFDEHKAQGRDRRECAASLVAKGLGVAERPEVRGFLSEVVRADKGEAKGTFLLPTLLNLLQRQGAEPARVIDIAFELFDAWCAPMPGPGGRVPSVDDLLVPWLHARFGNGVPPPARDGAQDAHVTAKALKDGQGRSVDGIIEVGHLLREAAKERKKETKDPLSLPMLLSRLPRSRGIEIAYAMLDAVYLDAQEFHRACAKEFDAAEVHDHGGFRVAVVSSDVEAMGAYARARQRVNVLFQRSGTGNVAVFTDPKGRKVLPALVRAILREELVRAGTPRAYPDAALVVDGIERDNAGRDLPVASWWYYHVECSMLLNGSKSKPGVEPTRLEAESFIRLFVEAVEESGKEKTAGPAAAVPA